MVEKALGAGGMGSVYRCHNHDAPRIRAAVKVLETTARSARGARERFVREAELTFQIDHPNVVKVRNIRIEHDPPYLEMEFVEGRSLEDRLQTGAVPLDEALDLAHQLARAVAYLHSRGIRHRDIKPANILIDARGTLKLVDFGLALEAGTDRITAENSSFGTVSYAPPEWVDPDRLDPAAWDMYAVGVVFYEMLTGGVAFPISGTGSARQQAMQVIVGKQGHPPLDPGEPFSDELRGLVRALTNADPTRRLVDARHLVRILDGMRGITTPTMPPPEAPVAADPVVRAGILVGAFGTIATFSAAAGIAVGLGFLWANTAPPLRNVTVRVSGPVVAVAVAGRPALRGADGTWLAPDVPLGATAITWVAGEGCTDATCPGEVCPVWCRTGAVDVVVGTEALALDVPPAEPRRVDVMVGAPDARVTVDGKPLVADGRIHSGPVAPGEHGVRATLGDCPPEPCADACPDGCTEVMADLVVPASGDVALELPLVAPEVPEPAPVASTPAPAPTPVAREPKLVTQARFAKFLEANPDLAPEGPRAPQGAYLQGWSGTTPPSPTDPVRDVSVSIA
ncbi:MAG: protein kinase, partial [Myxococcales bacterium]|nr:protein kinase [Myxococcales bacterium]